MKAAGTDIAPRNYDPLFSLETNVPALVTVMAKLTEAL